MKVIALPYSATHRFSPLVLDYLANANGSDAFISHPPSPSGMASAADARSFDLSDRAVLHAVILEQYSGLVIDPAVKRNIDLLAQEHTLTVTTGHQLCLFTGPLYVPFKILNTVRLAEQFARSKERSVVPIFWMATEDHDRPEIDHAYINGEKVIWNGAAEGAVGRMLLKGIEQVVERAIELLGPGRDVEKVAYLLREHYRPDKTLTQATRGFVNGLFGHLGVVCLDADHSALKRLFIPVMQEELLSQVAQRAVHYANEKLAEKYGAQAHAREINLFYLLDGKRTRIERSEDEYKVLDGGPRFTLDELLVELNSYPERFSPNVILRPIYQETILPNIAYVGGGGELAYWFQLKWVFQAVQVPMPALFLRTSAAFVSQKQLDQWHAMDLHLPDLFAQQHEVRNALVERSSSYRTNVDPERKVLDAFYNDLLERVATIDPTLRGSVEARRAKALHGLERIGKGIRRAAKQDQHVALERMRRIHEAVFPSGSLQERKENILPMLAAQGLGSLKELQEVLNPMEPEFVVIVQ